MRSIIKKNNLKHINMHDLRKTHATLLFEAGSTIKEVQERLGHKDVTVTMNIYASVTEQKQFEVANRFKEYLEG